MAWLAGRGIGCGGMLGWQAVSEMGGLVIAAFGIPAAAPPTPLDSARMLPCCCVSPGDAGTVWGARALPPSFSAPAAVSGDAPIAPWLGLPPPPPACAPACKRSGPGGRRGSRTWLGPIPVAGGPFPSPLAARSPPPPSTLPCMLPPPLHTLRAWVGAAHWLSALPLTWLCSVRTIWSHGGLLCLPRCSRSPQGANGVCARALRSLDRTADLAAPVGVSCGLHPGLGLHALMAGTVWMLGWGLLG